MKLWLDFCLGPFRFTFDPDGELDTETDESDPRTSGWPVDTATETAWQPHQAELHGEPSRSWGYDPGDRTGFRPTKE